MKRKTRTRWIAGLLAAFMLLTAAGCSGQDTQATDPEKTTAAVTTGGETTTAPTGEETIAEENLPPLKLSIMLPYGSSEYDNEEIVKKFHKDLETYTNTEIEWIWYDLDMYYEKLTLLFASGDLPSILITGKSAEFLNAVQNDAFWDVTDYYKD